MAGELTEFKCPQCGGRIKKMPSKFGDGFFYYCENSKTCNFKSNREEDIQKLEKMPTFKFDYDSNKNERAASFIRLEAKPLTSKGQSYFFRSFSLCPSLNVGASKDILDSGFGAFRIDYNFPSKIVADNHTLFIASLAKKLLLRGDPTYSSSRVAIELAKLFDFKNTLSNVEPFVLHSANDKNEYGYTVDSDREKEFLTKVIKPVFGQNWRSHVVTQAMLNSLAGNESFDVGQRVDFFLFQGDLRLVVELDGQEHLLHKAKDIERDKSLNAQGIEVIRFTNDYFDKYPEQCAKRLINFGFKSNSNPILNNDSKFVCSLNIIHQIQIMIVQGLIDGRFSSKQTFAIFGFYKEFDDETLKRIISIALDDLNELMNNFSDLYGFDSSFSFSLKNENPVFISFDSSNCSKDFVLIRGLFLKQKLLYSPEDSCYFEPTNIKLDLLSYFLKYIFRFEAFQEGQYEAIYRVLTKKDSIVLLPTGSGKSLIYQLSSFLTPGLTVVITPITSLMDDQVENLKEKGITSSLSIHWASQNNSNEEKMIQMMDSITSLIFISPERMQTETFRNQTAKMIISKYVYTVAIDEAHCVSEWGHDFRTAYLNIGKNTRKLFKKDGKTPALVALTGTASSAVLKDVQRELQIKQYDAIITPKTFDRPELSFIAVDTTVRHKYNAIEELLMNVLPTNLGIESGQIDRNLNKETCCGIIFCPHVNGQHGVLTLSAVLQQRFQRIGVYSGSSPNGYSDAEWDSIKTQTALDFKNNNLNILVATKAFGMGIDKPNIRYTIHYNIPGSIESFYQEAGRAGRDHKKSICVVTFSNTNATLNDYLLKPTTSVLDIAKQINGRGRNDDDVSRILYFHVNSFKGIDEEMHVVEYVVNALFPNGERNKQSYIFLKKENEEQKRDTFEKAIQRLTVLGAVSDYSVDYASEEYKITIANFTYNDVINCYLDYVRGYNEGRVAAERRKVEQHKEKPLKQFLLAMARSLIEFIYDTIEKGRRRGIREMSSMVAQALNDSKNADSIIRSRILDYLQSSYSKSIEEVLGDIDESIKAIIVLFDGYSNEEGEMCGGIRSSNEASALRGEVSRQLESTPDHPGLLFLRSLCECYSNEYNKDLVASDFEGAIEFAKTKYNYSDEQLSKILLYLLYKVYLRDEDLSLQLMAMCLKQLKTIDSVIVFCRRAVVEKYDFEAVRDKAMRVLLNASIEDSLNIVEEIKEY